MSSSELVRHRMADGAGVLVGEHRSVDDVGEPTLQRSHRVLSTATAVAASVEERDGVRVVARLRERDSVDGRVELSVAGSAEPVSVAVA